MLNANTVRKYLYYLYVYANIDIKSGHVAWQCWHNISTRQHKRIISEDQGTACKPCPYFAALTFSVALCREFAWLPVTVCQEESPKLLVVWAAVFAAN